MLKSWWRREGTKFPKAQHLNHFSSTSSHRAVLFYKQRKRGCNRIMIRPSSPAGKDLVLVKQKESRQWYVTIGESMDGRNNVKKKVRVWCVYVCEKPWNPPCQLCLYALFSMLLSVRAQMGVNSCMRCLFVFHVSSSGKVSSWRYLAIRWTVMMMNALQLSGVRP